MSNIPSSLPDATLPHDLSQRDAQLQKEFMAALEERFAGMERNAARLGAQVGILEEMVDRLQDECAAAKAAPAAHASTAASPIGSRSRWRRH